MSQKTAKAKRKKEKKETPKEPDLGNHLFDLTISVFDSGQFVMAAPKGASIPLALDCCIRACHRLWSMIVKRFTQKGEKPLIVPGRMADIDIIQEIKKQAKGAGK